MSAADVQVVVDQFEATNARNFRAVMDAYADEVVLRIHGDLAAMAGPGAEGKAAVGAWFGDWFSTFDRDYHLEINETQDLGDRVMMVATHHVRGRVSGAEATNRAAWLYTVRDGKIVACDVYGDREAALAEAGQAR